MERADLLTYLVNTLKGPAGQAGVKSADSPDGYQYVLDDAFRALGVAEADLATASVDAGLTGDAQALARYYAFSAFLDGISSQQDMVATQMRSSRTQPFTQMKQRLDQAAAELIRLGYGARVGLTKKTKLRPMGTV